MEKTPQGHHPRLYVRRCGLAGVDERWARTPLRDWFWRLYWFVSAEVDFIWPDATRRRADNGQVILLAPGQRFDRRMVTPGEHLFVHFAVEGFTEAFWREFLRGYESNEVNAAAEADLHVLRRLLEEKAAGSFVLEMKALSVVAQFLYRSVARAGSERPGMMTAAVLGDDRLAGALALARSTGGTATVTDLAEACCYSSDHFSRRFKEVYRVSPSVFLAEIRMRKAIERLVNSGDSMESIAEECGFTDRSYFSRCVREWTGVGPATYRKLHRNAS